MRATLQRPRNAALVVLVGAALTVGGALFFEHGLGYVPCKLCLTERVPYYLAILLAPLAYVVPGRGGRLILGLIALVLLYGAGLGVYHAGAEWGFWPGPSDCGGGSGAGPADVGDFLKDLAFKQTVDCTKAAWRFLGVSLAGWNALLAFLLASIAGSAAVSK
ncbi:MULTISPECIES: disulfide bond formation protein B [Methylobacterium]|uniref:Disulfide bond formation protein B n=1 Tax=Methylobacterium thuringiense TaxID=1003091 RepID=A0ABQ4TGH3_9HYPH|nr:MULTISPECIES: disulfide bond formation protein B [Methylobacterium]TXN21100.1 disulfide bond formation protein B [Methylobacterium sp. WL9]GJE54021.1 Disulfide bond formation protein B [Methylobacterium thuringiense]